MMWDAVARLPDRIAGFGPWRRRGILFLLGGLTTLGLPPLDFWPIAFLTLPPLIWFLESVRSRRSAFGTGWWFAFGYFAIGWYWISNALLVFSASFWWMIPFALIGLPGAMAIYYGLAALVPDYLVGRGAQRRLARILLLALAFAGADWLRGVLMTGFPWNTFGYLWSGTEALSQSVALVGVYGIGLLVLVNGLLPALVVAGAGTRPLLRAGLAAAVAFPLVAYIGGSVRLFLAPDFTAQQTDESRPGLRMVQGNIPQREKWARDFRLRNFQTFLSESAVDRPDWVTAVLWPETAAAFMIAEQPDMLTAAGGFAAPRDGYLITGAPRREDDPYRLYNAMLALDSDGAIRAAYDKAHLVPFGEYVPLGAYMPFGKVTVGAVDFSPGPGPRTIRLPGLPGFSPLICYEVIFPGAVTDPADRPDWILNATNDAWYGSTAGPYQHLQHARLRAVEEGLPLVRPASTGVSIAFDGYGREIARIPLNERGVVDFRLPEPLPATVYAQYGNLPFALMLLLLSGIALMILRR